MLDRFHFNFFSCAHKSSKEDSVYYGATYNLHCHLRSVRGHNFSSCINFQIFRFFCSIDNNYSIIFYPVCNINSFEEGCILNNNIIRSVYLASEPD